MIWKAHRYKMQPRLIEPVSSKLRPRVTLGKDEPLVLRAMRDFERLDVEDLRNRILALLPKKR